MGEISSVQDGLSSLTIVQPGVLVAADSESVVLNPPVEVVIRIGRRRMRDGQKE